MKRRHLASAAAAVSVLTGAPFTAHASTGAPQHHRSAIAWCDSKLDIPGAPDTGTCSEGLPCPWADGAPTDDCPPPEPAGQLATTGTDDTTAAIACGAGLLALGFGVLAFTRRTGT